MNIVKSNQIAVGSILMYEGGLYRILVLNEKDVILVEVNTDCTNVLRFTMQYFRYLMDTGDMEIAAEWENRFKPAKMLTEEEEKEIAFRAEKIETLLQKMYPEWERIQSREIKPEIQEFQREIGRSKATALKMIRRYLQSGRDRYALVDLRKGEKNRQNTYKTGDTVRGYGNTKVKNDEKLAEIFQDGFAFFMKNKENGGTVEAAYRYIVNKYYAQSEFVDGALIKKLLPKDEVPSCKRFRNYCMKQCDAPITKMKMGERDRRNNERLLHGNSQSGCSGPGQIVEVDEVEIDMINVASDGSGRVVGRSVMYLAVDVYSCCIVGCWVGSDNNSFLGLTNLLMTFLEDPTERLRKYGIAVPKAIVPSGFLPNEIRTDHGSEYTSSDIRRINTEIGMNISLVAPATGSLKGLVEQAFHQFHEIIRGSAQGIGVIQKTHDSRHYETACTDIEDIRKIAYEFVVYYNQHLRPGYALTREMIEAEIPAIPAKLWQYGCEHISSPKWITTEMKERILFALLKTDREFKISRKGITHKGLYYECSEKWLMDRMRKAGKNIEKIEGVRYDPRSINSIYMMVEGRVCEIPLNEIREEQKSFCDMTWKAYDELHKKKNMLRKNLDHYELENAINIQNKVAGVIETAQQMEEIGRGIRGRRKNIREAAKEEKEKQAIENSVSRRMSDLTRKGSLPYIDQLPYPEEKIPAEDEVYTEDTGNMNVISLDDDDSIFDDRFGL